MRKARKKNWEISLPFMRWALDMRWVRLAGHKSFRIIWPRMAAVWRGRGHRGWEIKKEKRNDEWSGNVYNRYPVEMVINQFSWRKSVSAPSFKGTRAKIKFNFFFLFFVQSHARRRHDTLLFVIHIFVPHLCALFMWILLPFLLYCKRRKDQEKKCRIFFRFDIFFWNSLNLWALFYGKEHYFMGWAKRSRWRKENV